MKITLNDPKTLERFFTPEQIKTLEAQGALEIRTRRCRVCEHRSMGDRVPEEADKIAAPSGLIHLTEGSGYTFCGKDCAPWEHRAGPR